MRRCGQPSAAGHRAAGRRRRAARRRRVLARSPAGTRVGAPFTSALDPRLGVDGLSGVLPRRRSALVAAPALVLLVRVPRADAPAAARVGVLTAAFLLVLAARALRPRPAHVPRRLGADDARAGGVILVGAQRRPAARRTVFAYVAITHLGGAGVWVALLLLARARRDRRPSALARAPALQVAIALAALVGFGTKAGRRCRCTSGCRARTRSRRRHVSALMSGVMIKVALYGLVRVLRRVARDACRSGSALLVLGARRAVGGRRRRSTRSSSTISSACSRSTRSRTSASSCSGSARACCCARAAPTTWAAFALAAALLHTLNHAVFKALLFLGAGAFERAVGALELDRLGGLLRRMPWTGGAFLVGALAIAGLPPLNGFASEWLTLQALLHVAVVRRASATASPARVALAALAATAALAVLLLRQGRRARAARAAAARGVRAGAVEAPLAMRAARRRPRGRLRRARRRARAALRARSSALAPWRARGAGPASGSPCPATGSLPTLGDRARRSSRLVGAAARSRAADARGARADLGLRPARRAARCLDERRLHEAAAARARGGAAAASARSRCDASGGVVQEVSLHAAGCRT